MKASEPRGRKSRSKARPPSPCCSVESRLRRIEDGRLNYECQACKGIWSRAPNSPGLRIVVSNSVADIVERQVSPPELRFIAGGRRTQRRKPHSHGPGPVWSGNVIHLFPRPK
jgi:hypothetical protein